MKRQYAHVIINDKHLSAEVVDGDVKGWQPITLQELNTDIPKCIIYLEGIKKAVYETKERKKD